MTLSCQLAQTVPAVALEVPVPGLHFNGWFLPVPWGLSRFKPENSAPPQPRPGPLVVAHLRRKVPSPLTTLPRPRDRHQDSAGSGAPGDFPGWPQPKPLASPRCPGVALSPGLWTRSWLPSGSWGAGGRRGGWGRQEVMVRPRAGLRGWVTARSQAHSAPSWPCDLDFTSKPWFSHLRGGRESHGSRGGGQIRRARAWQLVSGKVVELPWH